MWRQGLRGSSGGVHEAEDEQRPINITSPIKVTLEGTGRILNNTWLHYILAVKKKKKVPQVERQRVYEAVIFWGFATIFLFWAAEFKVRHRKYPTSSQMLGFHLTRGSRLRYCFLSTSLFIWAISSSEAFRLFYGQLDGFLMLPWYCWPLTWGC